MVYTCPPIAALTLTTLQLRPGREYTHTPFTIFTIHSTLITTSLPTFHIHLVFIITPTTHIFNMSSPPTLRYHQHMHFRTTKGLTHSSPPSHTAPSLWPFSNF